MSQFACLGADCESTCCQDWTIFLDKSEYKALNKVMGQSRDGARRFRRHIRRFEGTPEIKPSNHHFAIIEMDPVSRQCGLVTEAGWCSVHAESGESALGSVCALFPRMQSYFGQRTELSGSIACPEVARRALLDPDGVQLDEVASRQSFERPLIIHAIDEQETRPYFTHLDTVRGVFAHLLLAKDHPLVVRWLTMAMFGQRTAGDFHRDADEPGATEALARHGEACLAPTVMAEAAAFLDKVDASPEVSARLLVLFLSAAATGTQVDGFRLLVRDVMNTYLARSNQATLDANTAELHIQPAPTLQVFRQLDTWLKQVMGAHIDTVLTRFSHYYFFTHWHTASPNLLLYVQRMLIETTLFRFLVTGHPDLVSCTDALRSPDGQLPDTLDEAQLKNLHETWNAATITVCHLLARSLEHTPQTIAAIESSLAAQGLQSLGLIVYLLRT